MAIKKTKRRGKYKEKTFGHNQETINLNLNHVERELSALKANSGGSKVPYGAITDIVKIMKPLLPWLTKNMIQNRMRKLTHRVLDGYRLADDEEELRQEGHMPRSWMTIEGTLSTLQGSGDNEENNRQHLHRCALLPVAVHDNDANEPAPVPPRGKEDGYHPMTDSGRTTTTQATTPVNMIIQQHTCEDLVTTTASTAEDLNDSGLAQQQLITITEESVLVVVIRLDGLKAPQLQARER